MKINKSKIRFYAAVFLLTGLLTGFYYLHESFPKPLRAFTALLATPTAVTSGLSYYLNLGIPVYDSPVAVVISNLIASFLIVFIIKKYLLKRFFEAK